MNVRRHKWKNNSLLKHKTATTKIPVISTWHKGAECHGFPGNKGNYMAEKAPLSSAFPRKTGRWEYTENWQQMQKTDSIQSSSKPSGPVSVKKSEKKRLVALSPVVVAHKIWMVVICSQSLYLLSPGFTNDLCLFKPLFNYVIPCSYHIGH